MRELLIFLTLRVWRTASAAAVRPGRCTVAARHAADRCPR
ncbi:hypothetical protein I549_4467 [Mycobacterium avium subsp. avium 2285 (R)]|nr:hypothetical protein I549_4467 [Mycobacterium avium subsp. avium 2285 (R)]